MRQTILENATVPASGYWTIVVELPVSCLLSRIKNCTKIENADACTSEILIETECKMRS